MERHAVDPVALVAGLLFALSGAAMIADRELEQLDVTAFTAAGVAVIGLVLTAVIISRQLRDAIRRSGEFPAADPEPDDPTDPTVVS